MSKQVGSLLEVFEGAGVAGRRRNDPLAAAFERGRAEGLTEGVFAGRSQGREEGRSEGFEAGLAEGLQKGREEGRAAAGQDRDAALAVIAKSLETLTAERQEAQRRFAAVAAATVRASVSALLPHLARRGLADEVAQISAEICAGGSIGAATLRVAPEHEVSARSALEALPQNAATAARDQADAATALPTLRQADAEAAASPVPLGPLTPMSRGALAWRLTIPQDRTPPCGGLVPALIEWPGGGCPPAEAMAEGPMRLKSLTRRADPTAAAALEALGLAATIPEGETGGRPLRAVISTAGGEAVLD